MYVGCKKAEVSNNSPESGATSAINATVIVDQALKSTAVSAGHSPDLPEIPPPTTRPDDPQRIAAIIAPLKSNPRGPTTDLSVDRLPDSLSAQAKYQIGMLAAHDSNPEVRQKALDTLGQLRSDLPRELVPLLMKILDGKDNSSERSSAMILLEGMGAAAKPAVPLLTKLANQDPDEGMREAAGDLIVKLTFDGSIKPGPGSSELGRKLVGTWRGGRGKPRDEMTLTLVDDGKYLITSEQGKEPAGAQWIVSGDRLVLLSREDADKPVKPVRSWHILTIDSNVMIVAGEHRATYQRVGAR